MKLREAKICLNCDGIFQGVVCPNCAGRSYHPLSTWRLPIAPDDRPLLVGSSRVRDKEAR